MPNPHAGTRNAPKKPGSHRNRVTGLAALAMFSLVGFGAQAKTGLLPGYFLGQAEAVEASAAAGPLDLSLGSASAEGCPCKGTNGHTLTNTVSSLSVGTAGNVVSAGVNTSKAYGLKTATTASTTESTKIVKVNVLGGLITADALKAVANVSATGTTLTPTGAGSTFSRLVIAGRKIPDKVADNTVINLPGLGSVTVKFVNAVTYGNVSAGVEVEMLRIQITTSNSLGLPVGTTLVVGEAFAGYARTALKAALTGYAETLGVTANIGSLLQEAASAGAISGIPNCVGSGGQTVTDSVANLSATGLLSISTATTTAMGGAQGKANVADTTSSIGQISLLGGLITANSILAVAEESRTGGKSTASSLGSSFGSLNVAGVAIASTVPANTTIALTNLGYVVLNEQPPASDNHIQVNGLHVYVTTANSLGLPVGAEIFLAHAEATATGL